MIKCFSSQFKNCPVWPFWLPTEVIFHCPHVCRAGQLILQELYMSQELMNHSSPRGSAKVHVVVNWQQRLRLPSVFMPLDHNPIWSKICHFVWTKLQFKCLVLRPAVRIFQKYSVSAFFMQKLNVLGKAQNRNGARAIPPGLVICLYLWKAAEQEGEHWWTSQKCLGN